jgi:hypothetical protein
MKMLDAIILTLKESDSPLSVNEIYAKIIERKYFEFKSKNPISILSAEIQRNSLSMKKVSSVTSPKIEELDGKLFRLRIH